MDKVISLVNFINTNIAAISLLAAIFGGIFTLVKFREYIKDKRFNTYHSLLKDLVDGSNNPGGYLKLDRQIAIIFELRNFPEYFEVTERILTDLRNDHWKDNHRLSKEIGFTLAHINKTGLRNFFKKKDC